MADLPQPRIEWHRYRRHLYRCRCCQQTCQGRGDLELPGSHIGPRARLLTCYGRVHLGISLGKTQNLLHDFFGLSISRAGLLGHSVGAANCSPPWSRNSSNGSVNLPWSRGTNRLANQRPDRLGLVFRDPRLALFLIDRHRSRDVIARVLGESFAGTLVSDFYAAYNGLDCAKQRCLTHLLRELAKLREELPWQSVRAFIPPLSTCFRTLSPWAKTVRGLVPRRSTKPPSNSSIVATI